jgi:glycine/D-amino acid oxidase-like deaminating enzyme/nitrite reductase/ring-hydroxylating ferredoxin subunit
MSPLHASVWIATAKGAGRPRLHGDLDTDVCVVGAGIAGLTAARLAQRTGLRVAVIDASRLAARDSGHTTAHLTEILDAGYRTIRSHFGRQGAILAAVSQRAAIERIARMAEEEAIECRLSRVPAFVWARTRADVPGLKEELEAMREAGMKARWVRECPMPDEVAGAIRVEDQAQFHPREYLLGLADRIAADGGRLFEGTRALKMSEGSPCRVETARGTITCREVVVATHAPVSTRFALHTKMAPYRTYAVAAKVASPPPPGLYYDTDAPYHYVRTQETSKGPYLVVGGEDHKVGHDDDTPARLGRLERWVKDRWKGAEIAYRWSGQIWEPADGLAFIGRAPGSKRIWVASAFSGTGMTFGTLAGMIIADGIAGRDNPFAKLYDATRVKPLAQAKKFVQENVDVAKQLAKDRLDRGEVRSAREIAPGEGKLLRHRGKMVAAYRTPTGELRACSAVCTHLGCHVQWNDAEASWDCPCHGSRFDTQGAVLNGPAVKALKRVQLEEEEDRPGA